MLGGAGAQLEERKRVPATSHGRAPDGWEARADDAVLEHAVHDLLAARGEVVVVAGGPVAVQQVALHVLVARASVEGDDDCQPRRGRARGVVHDGADLVDLGERGLEVVLHDFDDDRAVAGVGNGLDVGAAIAPADVPRGTCISDVLDDAGQPSPSESAFDQARHRAVARAELQPQDRRGQPRRAAIGLARLLARCIEPARVLRFMLHAFLATIVAEAAARLNGSAGRR